MKEANETVGKASKLVSFGEAVKALKEGKRIQRQGWEGRDGKKLFIFEQISSEVSVKIIKIMSSLPKCVKDEFLRRHKKYENTTNIELKNFRKHSNSIVYRNQLAMVYPDNTICGWVASPSDILENDWIILD